MAAMKLNETMQMTDSKMDCHNSEKQMQETQNKHCGGFCKCVFVTSYQTTMPKGDTLNAAYILRTYTSVADENVTAVHVAPPSQPPKFIS